MKIDLNLFIVLEAIYTQGTLTKAAECLNLTQPAISHALSRLRERLNDPLFVRQGHKMMPTPLAKNLMPEVQSALNQLNQAVLNAGSFDPKNNIKDFRIAMRGIVEAVLMSDIASSLSTLGNQLSITSLRSRRNEIEKKLASGELDFAIDVSFPTSNQISQQQIFNDKLVVIMRKDSSIIKQPLSESDYLKYSQIAVSARSSGPDLVDYALLTQGLKRNIKIRCQHYYVACEVVETTNLLLTVPEIYGRKLCRHFEKLTLVPCPVKTDPVDIYLYWHKALDHDATSIWFRKLLTQLTTLKLAMHNNKEIDSMHL